MSISVLKRKNKGRPASRVSLGSGGGVRELPRQLQRAFSTPHFWNNTTQNLTWSKGPGPLMSEGEGRGPEGCGVSVKSQGQKTGLKPHFSTPHSSTLVLSLLAVEVNFLSVCVSAEGGGGWGHCGLSHPGLPGW